MRNAEILRRSQRELAERMGGTLVLAGAEGEIGTRFRLDLPTAEPGSEPAPTPSATPSRAAG